MDMGQKRRGVCLIVAVWLMLSVFGAAPLAAPFQGLEEGFDYPEDAVFGQSVTEDMPWYTVGNLVEYFTPSIEKQDDESHLAMQLGAGDNISEHQILRTKVWDTPLEGQLKFRFSIYIPSDIASGESTVYNTSGSNNFLVCLMGSTAPYEMVSFRFVPNTREKGKVVMQHIPQTSAPDDATYTEDGPAVEDGLSMDSWITVEALVDTETKQYSFTATDGVTTVDTGETNICRNTSNEKLRDETGNPQYLQTYFQKNQSGGLFYLDDISLEPAQAADMVLAEEFNYSTDATFGPEATEDMPWFRNTPAGTVAEFQPAISQVDGNTVLEMKVGPTAATTEHQMLRRQIKETALEGVIDFDFSIYVPSNVPSGDGTVYNTGLGNHNFYVSLVNARPDEILTFRFLPNVNEPGKVCLHHIPQTSAMDEEYTETGVTVTNNLKGDTWIHVSAQVDTYSNTYRFTATDGEITVGGDETYTCRNASKSNFGGKPLYVQTFVERAQKNGLYYVDDMYISTRDDAGLVAADISAVQVPEEVVENFTLPTVGSVNGSNITWESLSPAVVVGEGGLCTIVPQEEDTLVTLRGTFSRGGYQTSADFSVLVKSKSYIEETALSRILEGLAFQTISGGEKEYYVTKSFTPQIPGLPQGASAQYTSDNNAALEMVDAQAVVKRGDEDQPVTFGVTLSDAAGHSATRSYQLLVLGTGQSLWTETFDYPQLAGKSISGTGGWVVENENTNPDVTGALTTIEPGEQSDQDLVLNIQKLRSYPTANQYAVYSGNISTMGKVAIQSRMKITGEGNWFNFYVNGTYTANGQTVQSKGNLFQLSFDNTKNPKGIYGPTSTENVYELLYEGDIPLNEWFNFRVIVDMANKTYDMYLNADKLNTEPLPLYIQGYPTSIDPEDIQVSGISQIMIGAARHPNVQGALQMDDLTVRILAQDEELLELAKEALTIPRKEIMYDIQLPSVGAYDTKVTWKSQQPDIIADDGKVTRKSGLGQDIVLLTATLERGGASVTKDFYMEVVRLPQYFIQNLHFQSAQGSETFAPEPGGTLETLTLKENAAVDGARVTAAVYDGGKLVGVRTAEAKSGEITLNLPISGEKPVVKAFVWDSAMAPLAYSYETKNQMEEGESVKVFLCGDSTMENVNNPEGTPLKERQTGWGQVLQELFDENHVVVENHAKGGKSSKSFYDEGRLTQVFENIRPGDYMIIQFGHNDQKVNEPQNYTTKGEDGTYRQYLTKYIEGARSKGAVPILATSVYRRQFSGNVPKDSADGYPQEMVALAQTLDVPVLDMHTASGQWLAELGYEGAEPYYMFSVDGTDNTHFTYPGAMEMAKLAAQEMRRIGLDLAAYLK